jgi:signal transduction histidine kinase
MAQSSFSSGLDFSQDRSNLKWIVLIFSVLISIGSIFYTNVLIEQLKERETQQIKLYAKALEYTINETMDQDIYFVTDEILIQNNSIPRILIAENGEIISYRNIDVDSSLSQAEQNKVIYAELEEMREDYDPIEVVDRDSETNEVVTINYVYYKNSFLLTQLSYYPYIQLSVIAIFGFISYMAFNYSKAAEQNRVWVGLAKETAHQLGTPISSLMAWVEYFKEQASIRDKELISELDKDIQKLQIITERFSNIGSEPVLQEVNVEELVRTVVDYLRPRISPKIEIEVNALTSEITAQLNPPLFEWVIENLCKNAVDAMGGNGKITIQLIKGSEGRVFIDISDTGKGIPKAKIKQVFNPGFTTKKRGWGLGLTLAKRIIENYHKGKIFVKHSEENEGTTFRISIWA